MWILLHSLYHWACGRYMSSAASRSFFPLLFANFRLLMLFCEAVLLYLDSQSLQTFIVFYYLPEPHLMAFLP